MRHDIGQFLEEAFIFAVVAAATTALCLMIGCR